MAENPIVILGKIGDCDGNAMRMFSDCGLIFSEVNLYEIVS